MNFVLGFILGVLLVSYNPELGSAAISLVNDLVESVTNLERN